MMAARQSSGARCRRRQAHAASFELGMSSTRSLRSCPSRERRTRRSRWWVAAVSSAPARRSHGDGGGKNGQWPSPKAWMARLGSRRGIGGHGGAVVELVVAFLRRRAGASAAELARQQWRGVAALLLCFGRAEEQRKMWRWWGLTDARRGFNCRAQARRGLAGQAIGDTRRTRVGEVL